MGRPREVVIWEMAGHTRSRAVCRAMLEGVLKSGDRCQVKGTMAYRGPEGDVGIFYGLTTPLNQALAAYPAAGKTAVYADLGYWKRKDGGRYAGYHKLVVNGRHPTSYFQRVQHPHDRLQALGITMSGNRRSTGSILVCGMGPKGAAAEGYRVNQWEQAMVDQIRRHSDRPIIYRPKPNWAEARPIHGATMVRGPELVTACLDDVHCVVSHHSNANIEALVHSAVPGFTFEGPALAISRSTEDLELIETPRCVEHRDRIQWAADLAYTQWSIAEMASGRAWAHMRGEGLV